MKFAFTREELSVLPVHRHDINLRITVQIVRPIRSDAGREKPDGPVSAQPGKDFLTDILIGRGDKPLDKILPDLIQDHLCIIHLQLSFIRIDISEPEPDEWISNEIKSLPGFFRILFCHRSFSDGKSQIDQRRKIRHQPGCLHSQRTRNLPQLMISFRYHPYDGKIVNGRHDFILQKKIGFFIQEAVFRKNHSLHLPEQIVSVIKKFQILWHAACDRILLYCLFKGKLLRGINIRKRQRSQPDLCRPASIQRTLIGQRMFLHHSDQRSTQDQHHMIILQQFIPGVLQNRRKSLIRFHQIREFIYDQDFLFLRPVLCNQAEQIHPVRKSDTLQYGIFLCPCDHACHPSHALRFYFLCRKKIKRTFIFYEFLDQRCFSNPSSSIDHNKSAVPVIFPFQSFYFLLSSDKLHAVPSFIIIYFMIILFMIILFI